MKLMRMISAFIICACLISGYYPRHQFLITYPKPLPDSAAINYMPGIVTSTGLDFNAAFSPDGKSFYFGRSEHGRWIMYVTSFDGKEWTKPVHPSFNDTSYSEADPAFAPDGTLYYVSTKPKNNMDTIKDYDIWFVQPKGGNTWSKPVNMPVVNSDSNELYVSFSANNNLYFSSSRPGGFGQEDIYVCRYKSGQYAVPENLGIGINSAGSDHDPLISKTEDYLIFSSVDRKDGYGQADLYFSTRNDKMIWSTAANLGGRFNTATYEYCSYLTPDDRYFFYSTDSDIKWIKSDYLLKEIKSRSFGSQNRQSRD